MRGSAGRGLTLSLEETDFRLQVLDFLAEELDQVLQVLSLAVEVVLVLLLLVLFLLRGCDARRVKCDAM